MSIECYGIDMLIALSGRNQYGGSIGTGKSEVARALAERLGGRVVKIAQPLIDALPPGVVPGSREYRELLDLAGERARIQDKYALVNKCIDSFGSCHSIIIVEDVRFDFELDSLRSKGKYFCHFELSRTSDKLQMPLTTEAGLTQRGIQINNNARSMDDVLTEIMRLILECHYGYDSELDILSHMVKEL
jgi:hypothetical protein